MSPNPYPGGEFTLSWLKSEPYPKTLPGWRMPPSVDKLYSNTGFDAWYVHATV